LIKGGEKGGSTSAGGERIWEMSVFSYPRMKESTRLLFSWRRGQKGDVLYPQRGKGGGPHIPILKEKGSEQLTGKGSPCSWGKGKALSPGEKRLCGDGFSAAEKEKNPMPKK